MVLYISCTILISYLVNKKSGLAGDFSTGGRQFGWLTVGISILATYVSTMTFVGLPGWVYQHGMQVLSIHLNYPIAIFFTAVFFIPIFYKLGITSIYEYLEQRFGISTRLINSFLFFVIQAISAGLILYTVSLIIIRFIPISIEEAIVFISLFTAIYTFCGGITTVIWTDVMQSCVLLIGSLIIFATLYSLMPEAIPTAELADKLVVLNFDTSLTSDSTVWAGLMAASFLHLSVYATNQMVVQRTLATRSVETAQKSMMICGYCSFFLYLFFSLMGVMLYIFYGGQEFTNSNEIILDFVFNYTNPVVIGIIMAAIMAAAMSTLDSSYNSMATVLTVDFYKRFIKPGESEQHYNRTSRKLSLVCSILIVIPSILAISNESVLKTVASLSSIFVGIFLGSFILGMFSKTANERGMICGSLFSMLAIAVCMINNIAWPWYSPVGTAAFIVTGLITSNLSGVLSEKQVAFINMQQGLYNKPTSSQYTLLGFGLVTVVFCYYLPEIILALM